MQPEKWKQLPSWEKQTCYALVSKLCFFLLLLRPGHPPNICAAKAAICQALACCNQQELKPTCIKTAMMLRQPVGHGLRQISESQRTRNTWVVVGRKRNLRRNFRNAFVARNVAFAREICQISFRELSRTYVSADFYRFTFATTHFAFASAGCISLKTTKRAFAAFRNINIKNCFRELSPCRRGEHSYVQFFACPFIGQKKRCSHVRLWPWIKRCKCLQLVCSTATTSSLVNFWGVLHRISLSWKQTTCCWRKARLTKAKVASSPTLLIWKSEGKPSP